MAAGGQELNIKIKSLNGDVLELSVPDDVSFFFLESVTMLSFSQ